MSLVLIVSCTKYDAKYWYESGKEIGYGEGVDRGVQICENNYKPMLKQFEPQENCILILFDKYTAKNICDQARYGCINLTRSWVPF